MSPLNAGEQFRAILTLLFLYVFYCPFKDISHILPIVKQRWEKTEAPQEKHDFLQTECDYLTHAQIEAQPIVKESRGRTMRH